MATTMEEQRKLAFPLREASDKRCTRRHLESIRTNTKPTDGGPNLEEVVAVGVRGATEAAEEEEEPAVQEGEDLAVARRSDSTVTADINLMRLFTVFLSNRQDLWVHFSSPAIEWSVSTNVQ